MLELPLQTDYEGLLRNLRREGTPSRVHFMELFWDGEIERAIWERFDLEQNLRRDDPDYWGWRSIRIHRFLGYDYVAAYLGNTGGPARTSWSAATRHSCPVRADAGGRTITRARSAAKMMSSVISGPIPRPPTP